MMKRAYAIGLLGAVLGASAFGFVACSSSDPAPSPGVGSDTGTGGTDTGTGGEVATDTGTGGTDTGTGGGDTDVDTGSPGEGGTDAGCGSTPTLHPPPADAGTSNPGVFCPFSAPTGGKNITCAAGQSCCETPAAAGTPSTCVTTGTASSPTACPVAKSTVWDCEGPANCGTGTVCCAVATSIATDATCGYDKAKGFKGTTCAAACAAGDFQICEAAGDCPAGKTCTPFKAQGNQIGYCK